MYKDRPLSSSYQPWPYNPLVILIRHESTKIIKEIIKDYATRKGFHANAFDLIIQILLISCSYKPTEIWLGNSNDVNIASDFLTKGATHEASEILQHAIKTKHIWLNKELIKKIAKHEIAKLHRLSNFKPQISQFSQKQTKILNTFNTDARISAFKLITKNNTYRAAAIEKNTKVKVIFKNIDPKICRTYAKKYHYLHTGRDDDIFAYGAFLENEKIPFAWVSYSYIGRTYKQHILTNANINPKNSLELTRAWNHENSPKNTLSLLYAFAHSHLQKEWKMKYNTHLKAIITSVNPNLGFKGSAFRAVGFGIIGEKPTSYHHLITKTGKRKFITRRRLNQYLARRKTENAYYITAAIPLLNTKELAVLLQGTKRSKPSESIYTVSNNEYRREEAFI